MKISKQNGFSAIEGLLVLVIVVVIGFVGWIVYQNQQTTKDKSNQQTAKNQTISEIVASVKGKVSQDVSAVKVTGADEGNDNSYVSFKTSGYDYLSAVQSKTFVNYAPKNPAQFETESQEASAHQQNKQTLTPVKNIVVEILQDNGFKEVANYPTEEIIGGGVMYEREADVCAVNITWLAAGISCVTKEELTKVATEVKPYVDALRVAKVDEPAGTAFGLLEVGTGTTNSNRYAILSTGIAGAYFYQENGKWVYYTSSQEGISCNDTINNPSAARAFSKVCRKPGEGL